MIRHVLGVDPSLSHTGLAVVCYGEPVNCRYLGAVDGGSGKRNDDIDKRAARIHMIATQVSGQIGVYRGEAPVLLVIEGPAFAKNQGSSWDRAGLWWRIVSTAISRGAQVAVVPPTVRAKWACGSGRGDKAAVAAAMYRRFQVNAESSDESDAAVLAYMGAHALGWLSEQPKYAIEALASVDWPASVQQEGTEAA